MKAGIKVISWVDAATHYTCATVDRSCVGSECMAWVAVGGFKCPACEGLNIDQIECCGSKMVVNTEGSCGMVPL